MKEYWMNRNCVSCRADADLTLLSKRPPPPGALRGAVVWVVGASQGLGEALALQFAALGARLVLSSRSLEKLEGVRAACAAHIPAEHVALVPLDLVGPVGDLEVAAERAFAAFGRLDYVVHNAGATGGIGRAGRTAGRVWRGLCSDVLPPLLRPRPPTPRGQPARDGRGDQPRGGGEAGGS